MTPQDVVRLYSGARPAGAEARDVHLADYGDARELRNTFYLATAGRDARQTHAFWTQAVFAGSLRAPMYVSSTAQMLNAVDRDERLIGYVWESEVAGGVQVIHRITPK